MDERELGALGVPTRVASLCAVLLFGIAASARAQTTGASSQPAQPAAAAPASAAGSDEHLTVLGHHSRFEPAPMPGAPMGPPPDKPSPHLGRYKISGDQTKKDGYDTQTGAYIAPFGTAYTGASPVADGLASRFQH